MELYNDYYESGFPLTEWPESSCESERWSPPSYNSSESDGLDNVPTPCVTFEEQSDEGTEEAIVGGILGFEEEEEEKEEEEQPVGLDKVPPKQEEACSSTQSNAVVVNANSAAPTQSDVTDQLSPLTVSLETSRQIQPMDQTPRRHMARTRRKAAYESSAMRKFVDLGQKWKGGRDSHKFCVEMAERCQLKKMPSLGDITRIRHALVSLEANLGYDSLEQFFRFAMVLLKDEKERPIPQDAVNYAVLKTLELLGAINEAHHDSD